MSASNSEKNRSKKRSHVVAFQNVKGLDVDSKIQSSNVSSAASGSSSSTPTQNLIPSSSAEFLSFSGNAHASEYDEKIESNVPVMNPDPSHVVIISQKTVGGSASSSAASEIGSEDGTQPTMDVDVVAGDEVAKPVTEDEIVTHQLKSLGTDRYLIQFNLAHAKFVDEKTAETLTSAFAQHVVTHASFAASNTFMKTNLSLMVVGKHKHLQHLSLYGCQLTPAQFSVLFDGLKTNKSILSLNLRYSLGNGKSKGFFKNADDIFAELNNFLITNTSIESLNLSENQLTAKKVKLFAEGVSISSLKKIDISGNNMGSTGFCMLLSGFRGEVFEARGSMGNSVKITDHNAAKQICATLQANRTLTSLQLQDVSNSWTTDGRIYQQLAANISIISFSMTKSQRVMHDLTSDECITSLCFLLESNRVLKKLKITFPFVDIFAQRIEGSIQRNPTLTIFSSKALDEKRKATVDEKLALNHQNNITEVYNWERAILLIAWNRANEFNAGTTTLNPLRHSFFPLIPLIVKMTEQEVIPKKEPVRRHGMYYRGN